MNKLIAILIAFGMLVTFTGCVSTYNASLTAAHKRADYVNSHDVQYYKHNDPYHHHTRPVVDPHHPGYNGVIPAPTYGGSKPAGYGSPSPKPAPTYNGVPGYNPPPKPAGSNASSKEIVCSRDADCPGVQRCQNINKSTQKGICK